MIFFILFLYSVAIYLSLFQSKNIINNGLYHFLIFLIFIITFSYLFGFRPKNSFTDTGVYLQSFYQLQNLELKNALAISPFEIGYTVIQWLISQMTSNEYIYLFVVFILYILAISKSFKSIYSKDYIFALILFISTPMFITMAGNIIRTGLAFALFMLGVSYLLVKKNKLAFLWMILSVTIHTTILPFVIIAFFIEKIKISTYLYLWIISVILFVTQIHLKLFPFITSFGKLEVYTGAAAFSQYGNNSIRYDFLLFNMLLIIILLIINKQIFKVQNKVMNYFLRMTIFAGIIFNILGFIAYSDRLAIYVWLFFIIAFIYFIIEFNKKIPLVLPTSIVFFMMVSIALKSYIFFH